jgi:hypothetical protein
VRFECLREAVVGTGVSLAFLFAGGGGGDVGPLWF